MLCSSFLHSVTKLVTPRTSLCEAQPREEGHYLVVNKIENARITLIWETSFKHKGQDLVSNSLTGTKKLHNDMKICVDRKYFMRIISFLWRCFISYRLLSPSLVGLSVCKIQCSQLFLTSVNLNFSGDVGGSLSRATQ